MKLTKQSARWTYLAFTIVTIFTLMANTCKASENLAQYTISHDRDSGHGVNFLLPGAGISGGDHRSTPVISDARQNRRIVVADASANSKYRFNDDSKLPPHLACGRTLLSVKKLEPQVSEAIKSNHLPELSRLLNTISQQLGTARKDMERALLLGAWKSPEFKKYGFDLTGLLDTVQTLDFIGVAFTDSYSHPVGKVPSSVADSTRRMFQELEVLLTQVDELNKKVGDKSPRTSWIDKIVTESAA
jgi:hypothetical protein